MRAVNEIILHCTATPPSMSVTIPTLDRWHRAAGMTSCGYHYVIARDGTIMHGRPLDVVGAHCKGHNETSIGIAYVGGVNEDMQPEDNRTPAQTIALRELCKSLQVVFGDLQISGHNRYAAKACPCFDVDTFKRSI